MSWKKRDDLSAFGDRLRRLMAEKSLHEVATAFYNTGLIKVTPRNSKKERTAFDKRDSAIGSIEKRIREHLNADGPDCLQGEYVLAYCKYFNCSTDYLFGFTDVKSPDIDIRKICERTGLSEQAVTILCEHTETQNGQSEIHRCWSRLLEGDGFLRIPFDWVTAFNEACEVLKCDAAVTAIDTVLKGEDPSSIEYNMIAVKKKPILKTKDGHYAAYYGMLNKIAQGVTSIMDDLVEQQIAERKVPEQAFDDLFLQYRNELYALKGEPEKIERPKDGEFRFNKHFMV